MTGGRTRRLAAGVVTSAAVLVGTVGVAPTPAGAAPVGPDLAIAGTVSPSNPTVDDALVYTYTITNVGDAVAVGGRLDVVLNGGVGTGGSRVASAPFGCSTLNSGGSFPQQVLTCPVGDVAPGATVSRTISIRVDTATTYTREAFANTRNGQGDTNYTNDRVILTSVVAPGTGGGGGGGGGNPLGALQALLVALLAALHL
jgi:hypothetical protein